MYIAPSRAFDSFPVARGPGFHADEADAAIDAIAPMLTAGTLRKIEEEAGEAGGARADNPPKGEAEDGEWSEAESIVAQADLYPIAMMVTGQWGPDVRGAFRELRLRSNPADRSRDYAPFFDRMRSLRAMFAELREKAMSQYERRARGRVARAERALAESSGRARAEARKALKALRSPQNIEWVSQIDRMDSAVAFVLRQEGRPAARRTILDKPAAAGGLPFGLRWWVLAAKGNSKLPFVAYSELPMSTCSGAGTCRVPMDAATRSRMRARGQAWCYSFRAFRYPRAFARMFLNTLANYADREFAILRAGGPSEPAGTSREDADEFAELRARAAVRGRGSDDDPNGRVWMQYVKAIAVAKTRRQRAERKGAPGRVVFMRLFVDGDVNTEDCLFEWMEACRQVGLGGEDVVARSRHIEVYGYSKCWQAFVNLDRYYAESGGSWPANYTVNLSSGSVYAGGEPGSKAARVRESMERLPVSRGYFEAVPLDSFIAELEEATRQRGKLRLPVVREVPFAFSRRRIDDFTRLNRVRGLRDLDGLLRGEWTGRLRDLPALRIRVRDEAERDELLAGRRPSPLEVEVIVDRGGRPRPVEQQVREFAYREYLSALLRDDDSFGALVRGELARDVGFPDEASYLKDMRRRALRKADGELTGGAAAFTEKALHDKALALVLHEVLWSYGLGGSCPLVCGNCSDRADPKDPDGRHRCASRDTYWGRSIHIGLH